MASAGFSIGDIVGRIRADVGELKKNLGDAKTETNGFVTFAKGAAGVAAAAFVAIGAAAAAIGLSAIKGAADLSNATGTIQAQLGVTADEANRLRGVAVDVWQEGFGENLQEVIGTIGTLRQQFKNASDGELKNMAVAAHGLADVFGFDVTESTRTASVMAKNFGITGEAAMDMIAYGAQNGANYSDELLDTLREYAPQFVKAGFSAEEMMGTLVAGAEAGAWNLDKVGDAMKEFQIRAIDGSVTTKEGFAAIGMNADDMAKKFTAGGDTAKKAFEETVKALAGMSDKVARDKAGVELFGTQWEDVGVDVIKAMADGSKGIEGFRGAAQKAAYDNMSLEDKVGSVGRQIQAQFAPALVGVVDTINNNVLPAFDAFRGAIELLTTGNFNGDLFGAMGISEDSPVVDFLFNVRDTLLEVWNNVVKVAQQVGEFLAPAWERLVEQLGILWEQSGPQIMAFFNSLWPILQVVAQTIGAVLVMAINILINVLTIVITYWNMWSPAVMAVVNFIMGLILGLVSFIGGIMVGIVAVVNVAFDLIAAYITFVFNTIRAIINGWSAFWNTAFAVAAAIVSAIMAQIGGFFQGAFNNARNIWNGIPGLFNSVVAWIRGALAAVPGVANQIFQDAMNTVRNIWNGIGGFFSGIVGTIRGALGGVGQAIRAPFESAFNWVSEKVNWVKEQLGKLDLSKRFSPSIEDRVRWSTKKVGGLYENFFDNIGNMAGDIKPDLTGAAATPGAIAGSNASSYNNAFNMRDMIVSNDVDSGRLIEKISVNNEAYQRNLTPQR